MRPFLHDRLQRWHGLVTLCNEVLTKLGRKDLDVAVAVRHFLGEAIAVQRQQQRPAAENQLLALEARYLSALEGIDPATQQVVRMGRRTMQRSAAMAVLIQAGDLVRGDWERDQQVLEQARADLQPILVAAQQLGLLDPSTEDLGSARLERLWRRVRETPQTAAAAHSVQLRLNSSDLLLLIAELIEHGRVAGDGGHPA
ncbi:MAG: hypothetical protein MUC36_19460 [Planctomycetes bacterium]|jgi:hypothetical protein|nr:hypothetical protein [Planctomycetota bacterium]